MNRAERLREALKAVLRDIEEYERVNNLAPNPGRKYCWDSVANAYEILEEDMASGPAGNGAIPMMPPPGLQ